MSSDEISGFENVRQEVDGHPMLGLLSYARAYWRRSHTRYQLFVGDAYLAIRSADRDRGCHRSRDQPVS